MSRMVNHRSSSSDAAEKKTFCQPPQLDHVWLSQHYKQIHIHMCREMVGLTQSSRFNNINQPVGLKEHQRFGSIPFVEEKQNMHTKHSTHIWQNSGNCIRWPILQKLLIKYSKSNLNIDSVVLGCNNLTSKALRSDTCCTRVDTALPATKLVSHTCLYAPAAEHHHTLASAKGWWCSGGDSLYLPTEGWPGWVDLAVGLTEINFPHWELNLDMVTHPSTNQAWHRATSLIWRTPNCNQW